MNIINNVGKVYKLITDADYRIITLANHGLCGKMNDEEYLTRLYKAIIKKHLDLDNPKSFNEKIQWLKLHDKNPEYSTMVDKYCVREYIERQIGEQYLIPLIGVWEHPEDIDFNSLPNQFVLKCNHNSGLGLCICRDKAKLNRQKVMKELTAGLNEDYYIHWREWPYRSVKRRIIAEQYICDDETVSFDKQELSDYKFYCFNGYVDCVMICFDRPSGDTKFYFFDKDWKLKRINKRGKEAPVDFTLPRPRCLDEMFEIAAKLSKGIPFVRVDLYESNGKVYFGELTLYPQSGFDPNYLPETDMYFGSLIDLSLAYDNKT